MCCQNFSDRMFACLFWDRVLFYSLVCPGTCCVAWVGLKCTEICWPQLFCHLQLRTIHHVRCSTYKIGTTPANVSLFPMFRVRQSCSIGQVWQWLLAVAKPGDQKEMGLLCSLFQMVQSMVTWFVAGCLITLWAPRLCCLLEKPISSYDVTQPLAHSLTRR